MKKFATSVVTLLGYKEEGIISSQEKQFFDFIAQYGKSYGTKAEYNFRLEEFTKKLNEIEEHNANPENTHRLGVNQFTDWTKDEFKRLLGFRSVEQHGNSSRGVGPQKQPATYLDTTNLADSVNWVTAGGVTPVKNQGQCGSCWSFSSTGAMEGAYYVLSSNLDLRSLSEQQLVDCSTENNACNGGAMILAFSYAEQHAIELESDYPYFSGTTMDSGACKADAKKGSVILTGYSHVPGSTPDQLKAAIQQQPVSIGIEADQTVFNQYQSGIITSEKCGTKLDHGVLAVGYGSEYGQDYYLVKNSWGPSWGESGYVRIGVKEGDGICGIQKDPAYPQAGVYHP